MNEDALVDLGAELFGISDRLARLGDKLVHEGPDVAAVRLSVRLAARTLRVACDELNDVVYPVSS